MIKRYDCVASNGEDAYPIERRNGEYVLFEDYETALAIAESDFKVLQRDYQKLVDKIGDLYREA